MGPRRSLAWLILMATGCDAGRGAPRLVPAPPLPASGVVIDLGAPLRRVEIPVPNGVDRTYGEDGSGAIVLGPGYPALRSDPERSDARLTPGRFVGEAVVLDLRDEVRADLGAVIDVEDLDAFEDEHGVIDADEIVVIVTGYDEAAPDTKRPETAYSSPSIAPGVSPAAMRRLVVERGVRRIATDAPAISSAADPEREAERLLLSSGGFFVVGLSRLSRLPTRGATLVLAPLDLERSSSSPLRALAIVPRR